jgi:predicted phosphodiesterase
LYSQMNIIYYIIKAMSRILRYVSDLHLELRTSIIHPKLVPLWDFKVTPKDQYYLALLGDIGNPYNENLLLFLEKISPLYHKIFYIAGNHEYYNYNISSEKSMAEFDEKLKQLCAKFDNVILLNNKTYDLGNIKIIGTTLWSNIPDADIEYISHAINDYHFIKKKNNDDLANITTNDTNQLNTNAIAFIEKEIITNNPCIVLTHHAPLFSDDKTHKYTADPKYISSRNNNAFHNDLAHLLKKPICAWLYGHTHYTSTFQINDIIVGTNQLGYSHEEIETKFNSYAYLDLDKISMNFL